MYMFILMFVLIFTQFPGFGMLDIKDSSLLIETTSTCNDGSRFPVAEWYFTICHIKYNTDEHNTHTHYIRILFHAELFQAKFRRL